MKKLLFFAIVALGAIAASANAAPAQGEGESGAPVRLTITTDANGEIASIVPCESQYDERAWHIKDVSGYTNVRNKPNGKVCMRLKAYTQYEIYTAGSQDGWLLISRIYNLTERYWVRLHDSSTGTYWIARSILY